MYAIRSYYVFPIGDEIKWKVSLVEEGLGNNFQIVFRFGSCYNQSILTLYWRRKLCARNMIGTIRYQRNFILVFCLNATAKCLIVYYNCIVV